MNYERLAAMAQRLIEKNGRDATLIKLSESATDTNKPWRGTQPPNDPDDSTDIEIDAKLVFLGTDEGLDKNGVRRRFQYAYVAAKSAIDDNSAEADLTGFDRVVDGSTTWTINDVDVVAPGTRKLCWKLRMYQ